MLQHWSDVEGFGGTSSAQRAPTVPTPGGMIKSTLLFKNKQNFASHKSALVSIFMIRYIANVNIRIRYAPLHVFVIMSLVLILYEQVVNISSRELILSVWTLFMMKTWLNRVPNIVLNSWEVIHTHIYYWHLEYTNNTCRCTNSSVLDNL